jgi:hypothetical protein
MRERLEAVSSRGSRGSSAQGGPVTRSRDQGLRAFATGMDAAEVAPSLPRSPSRAANSVDTLGETSAARVLVSDPMQRNLEAARKLSF